MTPADISQEVVPEVVSLEDTFSNVNSVPFILFLKDGLRGNMDRNIGSTPVSKSVLEHKTSNQEPISSFPDPSTIEAQIESSTKTNIGTDEDVIEHYSTQPMRKAMEEPKNETKNEVNSEPIIDDKPYSMFSHNEKKVIVLCASLCSFFSPISGQIYFPSLEAISSDLNVSFTLINLTITSYLVSLSF